MANIANITKTLDGDRFAVFHVFIQGDGTSGDLVDLTLIDPTHFIPSLGRKPSLTIAELWYSLSGFDAKLEFDYLTDDTGVWSLAPGNATNIDFSEIGGIKDRSNPLDGTGKLLLTTVGLLSGCGTIIIKIKKD